MTSGWLGNALVQSVEKPSFEVAFNCHPTGWCTLQKRLSPGTGSDYFDFAAYSVGCGNSSGGGEGVVRLYSSVV